jgi:hypothetical protein
MAIATDKAPAVIEGEFSVVRALVTPDQAMARWNEYQALVKKIIGPTDIQSFVEDGKTRTFIKKQGWQKLATYHGIGIEMVGERLFHKHDPKICLRAVMPDKYGEIVDCGCAVVGARYVVRATAPNGRTVEAIGLATFNEKKARYTRVEHDLAGKAFTRASNRAISAIIGAGEISAEEARVTGDAAGLSIEERNAIKAAWATAPHDNREAALAYMRDAGIRGETTADLFRGFAAAADETAVADLLRILRTVEKFDPDDLGLGDEPLPTEGGRT